MGTCLLLLLHDAPLASSRHALGPRRGYRRRLGVPGPGGNVHGPIAKIGSDDGGFVMDELVAGDGHVGPTRRDRGGPRPGAILLQLPLPIVHVRVGRRRRRAMRARARGIDGGLGRRPTRDLALVDEDRAGPQAL